MQVLHRKSRGAINDKQNIISMMRIEDKLISIKLKTWVSRTVSGGLEARVGVKYVHLGIYAPLRGIVCWKGKMTVVHWVFFPVVGNCEPWVISLDVMLSSGYVRRRLLGKNKIHLWDFLTDIWMQIKKEQMGLLWRDLY